MPHSPALRHLSPAAVLVHDSDRERFVTALFAPPPLREALMVLYAVNAEIAQVRERVREPLAGALRLQWWRDVVTGDRPADELEGYSLAAELRALVVGGQVPQALLLDLLEAREHDLTGQGFADLAALETYVDATAGGLAEAAAVVLGGDDDSRKAARRAGTAFGLVGLVRAVPAHMSTGWLTLPGAASRPAVAQAAKDVCGRAATVLAEARQMRIARRALPAALPAVIAGRALRLLAKADWDPFAAPTARPLTMPGRLMLAVLLGRI
jgi:phytoene/squalene synthetase